MGFHVSLGECMMLMVFGPQSPIIWVLGPLGQESSPSQGRAKLKDLQKPSPEAQCRY